MGYYVPVMNNHVLHIKAITHRKNPILQAIKAGSVEDTPPFGLIPGSQSLPGCEGCGRPGAGCQSLPYDFYLCNLHAEAL